MLNRRLVRGRLALQLVVLVALGCGSTYIKDDEPSLPTVPGDYCKHAPAKMVRIVGDDLYDNQAPLPCLRTYQSVQLRPGQDDKVAVAIAISGGGERAANYAFGVLLELEKITLKPRGNVLSEIDYFSTVSGGGFAAAGYLSHLHHHLATAKRQNAPAAFSLAGAASDIETALRHNFEHALWRAAIMPGHGRNEALRVGADEVILGRPPQEQSPVNSLKLGDVFVPNCPTMNGGVNAIQCGKTGVASPQLPYWFANATVAGNGAIFAFSPDILDLYRVSSYPYGPTDFSLNNMYEMPLTIGLVSSASFPGAVPPLPLTIDNPGRTELQLLDGGVADNLGVLTALAVLKQDPAKRKVLLVVDAYAGSSDPYQGRRNRLSTFAVLRKTPFVALDSWRGRHKYVVAAMARGLSEPGEHWQIIFLSFDDLADKAIKKRARSVGTRLAISEDDQRMLRDAAIEVVSAKRTAICKVFRCRQ